MRARSSGRLSYDLLGNNCEHFSPRSAITGEYYSGAAGDARVTSLFNAGTAALLVIGTVFMAGSASSWAARRADPA